MAISKIVPQSTGFGDANVGLQIPNISLENRAAEAANGTIFFNTSNNAIEIYANGAWTEVGTGSSTPLISSIEGEIESGNTGATIDIIGATFDINNTLVPGTVRFTYSGNIEDVTATPNTATTILKVSVPSAILNLSPSTTGTIQFIRGDSKLSNLFTKDMSANVFFTMDYLVLAGGGGGGTGWGITGSGGGGAGGHLTGTTIKKTSTGYTVTVGGGGAPAANGSNSIFDNISAFGGGRGSVYSGGPGALAIPAAPGGSGGGGSLSYPSGAAGTPGQGNAGGSEAGTTRGGGGGGGAGGNGGNSGASASVAGVGGIGAASPITGSPVLRGGGGGAGGCPYTGGSGGPGGGGNGGSCGSGSSGTANFGGGGGGNGTSSPDSPGGSVGGSGSSGIVILKYPNTISISNPGGGLTLSTSTSVPGYNITSITAGTGSVSWS